MVHFYTPWKRQKTSSFLTFSRGIEMKYSWVKKQKYQNLNVFILKALVHVKYLQYKILNSHQ